DLCVAEERRRPKPPDTAGRRVDGLEAVCLRKGRESRERVRAVDVAKVERALNTHHQIGGLEVAADLTATEKSLVILAAIVRKRRADRILRKPRRIDPAPGAPDIATDVAAGPVVDRCGGRRRLERHVCG